MVNQGNSNFKFSKYVEFMRNGNDIIVIHGNSGAWGEINANMLDKVKYCINNKIAPLEYVKSIENLEERQQLSEVFDALMEEDMLVNSEEKLKIDIKNVEFKMTNKCNLRCIHCGESSDIHNENILSTEDIKNILDNIFKLDINKLYLTGGEPLVRKDIKIILNYIADNFKGEVDLLTNGTFIDMDMAKLLRKCVAGVSISVDGYDEKSSEFVRGKGTFKKILSATENLKEGGFGKENIILTMTGIKQNVDHRDEFYEFCKKLDVTGAVRKFSAFGRGYENYDEIGVKDHLYFKDKSKNEIEEIKEGMDCKIFCNAGINKIMINEKGDIYPCLVLEYEDFKFGNALNINLKEEIKSERYSEFIEKMIKKTPVDNKEHCKNCNVKYFCMDKCAGVNYTYYDNDKICIERCNQVKPYLSRILWNN